MKTIKNLEKQEKGCIPFYERNIHPITGYNSSTYYTHVEVKASISENKHLKKKKK